MWNFNNMNSVINFNYYRLLPVMFLALLVCACAEDGHTDASSHQIRFAASPAYQVDHSTRSIVADSGLPQGDSVGIFTYSYTTTDSWVTTPDIYDNEKGIVGVYSDEGYSQVTLSVKEYVNGRNHAFYSYYPYQSTTSASNPEVNSDIFANLESDGSQTDWMWANPVTGVTPSPSPVALTYQHKMTLLRFTVAKTVDVNAGLYMEDLEIRTSTSQKFTLNVSSGVVTPQLGGATSYAASLLTTDEDGELKGIEIPLLGEEDTYATQLATEVLLLPQSSVTSLSFNINGETFTTPSDWIGVAASDAGRYYVVSIKVGISEITIQVGGQDWEDGRDIDLSQSDIGISLGSQGWSPGGDLNLSQSDITIALGGQDWNFGGNIDLSR